MAEQHEPTRRFVVLRHDVNESFGRLSHFDWMFDVADGEKLWTWSTPKLPDEETLTEALRLGDHRRSYLDYEGPISGDRGTVHRVDAGQFWWVDPPTLQADLAHYEMQVAGDRFRGRLVWSEISGRQWELTLRPTRQDDSPAAD